MKNHGQKVLHFGRCFSGIYRNPTDEKGIPGIRPGVSDLRREAAVGRHQLLKSPVRQDVVKSFPGPKAVPRFFYWMSLDWIWMNIVYIYIYVNMTYIYMYMYMYMYIVYFSWCAGNLEKIKASKDIKKYQNDNIRFSMQRNILAKQRLWGHGSFHIVSPWKVMVRSSLAVFATLSSRGPDVHLLHSWVDAWGGMRWPQSQKTWKNDEHPWAKIACWMLNKAEV